MRVHRDRPRRRAADRRGELAAVHSGGLEVDDHVGACMVTEFCLTEAARVGQNSLKDRPKVAWRTVIVRSTSEVAVCCSRASERCPRTSASSRVRASSCFFNSLSELDLLLTRAFALADRPRVLFSLSSAE